MGSEAPTVTDGGKEAHIAPSDLLATVSYMLDITPRDHYFHSWRTGLVSRRVASMLAPEAQRDVFYAGLLADLGAVGADMHITRYSSVGEQLKDRNIANHPVRSAALLDWLHGLETPARIIRSHHECWDGSGYPSRQIGNQIPVGSQIVGIADTADLMGCFQRDANVRERLETLAPFSGRAWSKDLWNALRKVVADDEFCTAITDDVGLPYTIAAEIDELGVPDKLNNQEGVERLLHLMAILVDFKDPTTREHSIRTARYAKILALEMRLTEQEAHHNYRAGLVHDIGRMGIPTFILGKQSALKEEEMNLVRKHADMTIKILSCLPDRPAMTELARIAGHDHERYDGSGYPHRLAGKSIPLMSRIISVADAFDVVTNPPSYRLPLSPRAAFARLKVDVRTQFDPDVIDALESAIHSGAVEDRSQAA